MIDLSKLEKMLDDALEKETPDSLYEWFRSKRIEKLQKRLGAYSNTFPTLVVNYKDDYKEQKNLFNQQKSNDPTKGLDYNKAS